jgi:hypothetical protein
MHRQMLLIMFIGLSQILSAQVAINSTGSTAHSSAMLDVQSTSKGALLPRMTWTQIQSIVQPAEGLLVYDIGLKGYRMYNGKSWMVLGPKDQELSDPFGFFSSRVAGGFGYGIGKATAFGSDASMYVGGDFNSTISFDGFSLNSAESTTSSFLAKYDQFGKIVWAVALSSTATALLADIALDASDNIYLMGTFSGTLDLDPGVGNDNHTSAGSSDLFFAKYDNTGHLIWGRHMGSTGFESGTSIGLDPTGNIYITGSFSLIVDFDTGPAVGSLTSFGSSDIFVAKYDSGANYIFAKGIGSVSSDRPAAMKVLSGFFILAGHFSVTVDFNPDAGVTNLSSSGPSDIFFGRYNLNGNLHWVNGIGTSGGDDYVSGITANEFGNIWITGSSLDIGTDLDFNPGPGTFIPTHHGNFDAFIASYSSGGGLINARFIGGPLQDEATGIQIDESGAIYITGFFQAGADFDPSSNVVNLTSYGGSDVFIVKYFPEPSFLWGTSMGSAGNDDRAMDFSIRPDGHLIFVTGYINGNPFKDFSGVRIFNNNKYFLARYAE